MVEGGVGFRERVLAVESSGTDASILEVSAQINPFSFFLLLVNPCVLVQRLSLHFPRPYKKRRRQAT